MGHRKKPWLTEVEDTADARCSRSVGIGSCYILTGDSLNEQTINKKCATVAHSERIDMANKIKKTIRIDEKNNAKVEQLANELGLTHQEIIDLAIESYNQPDAPMNSNEDLENLIKITRQVEKQNFVILAALNSLLQELGYRNYHSPEQNGNEIIEEAYREYANKMLAFRTRKINHE